MTMHNFLNNRLAATVITLMFLAASGASMLSGSTTAFGTDRLLLPDVVTTAHGPTMPPDPWEGTGSNLVAHGPTMPPDPWEGTGSNLIAHGPTMPPDPWEGTGSNLIAHGPTMPPDPWEGTGSNLIAHGPTMPARSVGRHRLQPDRARPHDAARSVGRHRLQPDRARSHDAARSVGGHRLQPDRARSHDAPRSVGRHWLELHCLIVAVLGVTTSEPLAPRPRIGVHAISSASGRLDDRGSPRTPRHSCAAAGTPSPISPFLPLLPRQFLDHRDRYLGERRLLCKDSRR